MGPCSAVYKHAQLVIVSIFDVIVVIMGIGKGKRLAGSEISYISVPGGDIKDWDRPIRSRVPAILPKPDDRSRSNPSLLSFSTTSFTASLDAAQLSIPKLPAIDEASPSSTTIITTATTTHPIASVLFRHHQPQYTGCRYDLAKPPYSYASLIAQALLSAPEKKLTLSQIYTWIMDNYPYYQSENHGWQNSIRHNLSLNSCFIKLVKGDHDTSGTCASSIAGNSKGSYWTVDEEQLAQFKDGAFKRRKLAKDSGEAMRRRRRRNRKNLNRSSHHSTGLIFEDSTMTNHHEIPMEQILPSICDACPPSEGNTWPSSPGITTGPPPLTKTHYPTPPYQVFCNDSTINGMHYGLAHDDVFRASSPSNSRLIQITKDINRVMSIDFVCPEMAEEHCLTFGRWKNQRPSSEVRTDYTDPLDLSRF